jgi:hypothetical protein
MYNDLRYLLGGLLFLAGGVYLLLFKYGYIHLNSSKLRLERDDTLLGIAGIVFDFAMLGGWLGLY